MSTTEWLPPNLALVIIEEKSPACYVGKRSGEYIAINTRQALAGCERRGKEGNPGEPFAYRKESNIFFAWER